MYLNGQDTLYNIAYYIIDIQFQQIPAVFLSKRHHVYLNGQDTLYDLIS